MRPQSRAHLARQLAAAITNAACEGQGQHWSAWEAAHAAATSPAQAEAAAAGAVALCAGCPAATIRCCADLAHIDGYTGLAAGAAYLNGARRPTAAVVSDPEPPRRRAG